MSRGDHVSVPLMEGPPVLLIICMPLNPGGWVGSQRNSNEILHRDAMQMHGLDFSERSGFGFWVLKNPLDLAIWILAQN